MSLIGGSYAAQYENAEGATERNVGSWLELEAMVNEYGVTYVTPWMITEKAASARKSLMYWLEILKPVQLAPADYIDKESAFFDDIVMLVSSEIKGVKRLIAKLSLVLGEVSDEEKENAWSKYYDLAGSLADY